MAAETPATSHDTPPAQTAHRRDRRLIIIVAGVALLARDAGLSRGTSMSKRTSKPTIGPVEFIDKVLRQAARDKKQEQFFRPSSESALFRASISVAVSQKNSQILQITF